MLEFLKVVAHDSTTDPYIHIFCKKYPGGNSLWQKFGRFHPYMATVRSGCEIALNMLFENTHTRQHIHDTLCNHASAWLIKSYEFGVF